jgi:hypothetical protein
MKKIWKKLLPKLLSGLIDAISLINDAIWWSADLNWSVSLYNQRNQ